MSRTPPSLRPVLRAAGLAVVAAALVPAAPHAFAQDAVASAKEKVVVIGFDGLAADRVERLMDEGKMPAFAALRAKGGYSRLATSNPAQSPVSWASIVTGGNPGETGIPDFLQRGLVPMPQSEADRDAGRPAVMRRDPSSIAFAHAEVAEREVLSDLQRVLVISGAAVLGAVAGLGIAFALGTRNRAWRKGRRFEALLSGGAAVGALVAFGGLRLVPDKVPTARSLRGGEPLWVTLDKAGVRTVNLEAPMCFPPDTMENGCCMAGLGVPDMAGSWGSFSLWSDDPAGASATETAGVGYFVDPRAPSFDIVVAGPVNKLLTPAAVAAIDADAKKERHVREISFGWTKAERRASETRELRIQQRKRLTAHLGVAIRRGQGATVTLQDGSTRELAPGVWSDLLPVSFRMSPLTTLHGRLRLLLDDAGSQEPPRPFRLFSGQVQWDPTALPPNVSLSSPRDFAAELERANGPMENIGWPEQTNAVKDDFLTDRAFVDHTYLLLKAREAKFRQQLAKGDFGLLFALFAEPDRVQHALYRHVDPQHALHDPEQAKIFGGEIDRIYVEADRIVGDAIRLAPPGTRVVVISDHGFAPFRRGVNLNMWLRSKGFQAIQGDDVAGSVADIAGGEFFTNVDWERTKAYGFGLGGIYLNLAGRERGGSVPITEADAVLDRIAAELSELKDEDGTKVVRKVYRGSEIFRGSRVAEMPDLVVGFEWGYRVSWQGTIGGKDAAIITPNKLRWSGDHCSVDPDLVPGVILSTTGIAPGAKPHVVDVAPSVLGFFGLTPTTPHGKDVLVR